MGRFIQRTRSILSWLRGKEQIARPLIPLLSGLFLAVLGIAATATAAGPSVRQAVKQVAVAKHHWYQIGSASWYGLQFQGRTTATGEKFDMNQLTCAHRSLPLGTWLRVTNLRNKKVVYVRVSDRGPEPENRIVDLSYAAAKAVGLSGVGEVRLDRVEADDPGLAKALISQAPLVSQIPMASPFLSASLTLPRR